MNESRSGRAGTPSRSQLVGTLVVLVLAVVALVLINHRTGTTGDAAAPNGPAATSSRQHTTGPITRTTGAAAGATAPAAGVDPQSGLPFVAASQLPAQARDTLELIAAGGPYPFPRNDNQTYFNNNRVLPRESSGYYKEFTVITPGSTTRGARRIIAGKAGELYYTADHYDSFRRIQEDR